VQQDGLENASLIELGLERVRIVGVALLVLGALAIVAPAFAGTLVSLIVGVVLLAAGISRGIRFFRTGSWKRDWPDAVLAGLAILAGGTIIAKPLVGLSAIAVALVVFFAVSGSLQVLWWWRLRRRRGALWTLLAGLATLALAVMIGAQWPLSGLWAVGTLVGIHLLFAGTSLIALSSPPPADEPGEDDVERDGDPTDGS
jgi:uncharacterized membrane protein HdeD (DUF308 family)